MEERAVSRTYGNWRTPRSAGLWNLGTLGTGLLLGGVVLAIIAVAVVGVLAGVVVIITVGVFLGSLMVRDRHGRSGLEAVGVAGGLVACALSGCPPLSLGSSGPQPLGHLSTARAAGPVTAE